MSFIELVEAVSSRTGLPKKLVSTVLRAFPIEAQKALEGGERVKFPSFGAFYTTEVRGRRRVRFLDSRSTRMEKLGVVLDDDKTKTATKGKNCPKCGRKVDGPYCDNCGTEPFEKRPDGK